MDTRILDNWAPEAWQLEGPVQGLRAPLAVLVGESADCARFAQRYWEPGMDPSGQREIRPGLVSAVGTGQFTATISEETLELGQALVMSHTQWRLLIDSVNTAPVDRARYVTSEIREVMQWFFDDGVTDDGDAQLTRLSEDAENATTHDAIGVALFQFAELAERHRDAIHGVGGFDAALIEEARQLAESLRMRSAGAATIQPPPGAVQALELRNRIGMMLYERMLRIRTAARFVFRRHPAIVREATSAYFRRQRSAHRRAKAEDGNVDQSEPVNPEAPTQAIPAVAPPSTPGE